ncbi:unnamed protein product [Macrosiphum euphorbiae]|uniref:RING-type domain-containing protein n=1 Tax=Macrosiphum euphorbiae TaxID=13131 RepID=A0AAV0YA72_9HEMI|nr:unnamed protein product [Macrosiphum euphorbiae]
MNYSLTTFGHNVQNCMIKLIMHLTYFSKKCHLSHLCATPSIYMMELDARARQLDLENIPFVPIQIVLPTLDNQDSKCIICIDADRTHAFIPCGHKILCGDCVNLLEPKRCPVCSEHFTNSIRIW